MAEKPKIEIKKNQEIDININIIVDQENGAVKGKNSRQLKVKEDEKINISLSVAQLAYLFRILSEMKIIKNSNLSDLMRFAANHISTPKAKDISFDSFKVKYYNPDLSTKRSIHDLLIKQLNYIRKDQNS